MRTMKLKIEGMSCGHCVKSVERELKKIPGVVVEHVDIGSATVNAEEDMVTGEMLSRAVEEAGYTLSEIG